MRAALAIQRALAQYAEEVEAAYGIELAVRIGINTGPVVVGVEQRRRRTATTPGTRSATRSTSPPACRSSPARAAIVVGPTTKRQVESCFELEELGSQELKGVGSAARRLPRHPRCARTSP